MPRCCGDSCSCNIQAGTGITITGIGSISDPFVVSQSAIVNAYDWHDASTEASVPGGGTADTPPDHPEGYLRVTLNGVDRYVPFY